MDQQVAEATLIEQTLAGNQAAFAQLVERYSGVVYNHAYRMLGNAHDAEDAVQEIFVRAYLHLATFDRARRFVNWLLSIASNYCIDRLRRRRYNWLTLDDVAFWLPSTAPGPERHALATERRDTVQAALQQLPASYRQVMVLRYWNDLSYQEIATVTGLTESTVKTRLHRGRKMLAAALGAAGEEQLWDAETTN